MPPTPRARYGEIENPSYTPLKLQAPSTPFRRTYCTQDFGCMYTGGAGEAAEGPPRHHRRSPEYSGIRRDAAPQTDPDSPSAPRPQSRSEGVPPRAAASSHDPMPLRTPLGPLLHAGSTPADGHSHGRRPQGKARTSRAHAIRHTGALGRARDLQTTRQLQLVGAARSAGLHFWSTGADQSLCA